jgi:hypothetical protein
MISRWILALPVLVLMGVTPAAAQGPGNLTYTINGGQTIGTTSTQVYTFGQSGTFFFLSAYSANAASCWVNVTGGLAVSGQGAEILAGSGLYFGSQQFPLPKGNLTVVCGAGGGISWYGG